MWRRYLDIDSSESGTVDKVNVSRQEEIFFCWRSHLWRQPSRLMKRRRDEGEKRRRRGEEEKRRRGEEGVRGEGQGEKGEVPLTEHVSGDKQVVEKSYSAGNHSGAVTCADAVPEPELLLAIREGRFVEGRFPMKAFKTIIG